MSTLVLWEADYILQCFLWGLCLIVVYDILRIIRIVIPHPNILVGIEDILYWICASIGMFFVLYKGNDGVIRFFAIGTTAATMGFVNTCISRFTVPFLGNILAFPFRVVSKFLHNIQRKLKQIFGKQLKKVKEKAKIRKEKKAKVKKEKADKLLKEKEKRGWSDVKKTDTKETANPEKKQKRKKKQKERENKK